MKPKLLVDADACPRSCMQRLREAQQLYGFRLITVASFRHNIASDDHITVGDERDATDMVIMNHTEPGDLVITQDWGLAAVVVGKGERALSPTGKEYAPGRIDFLLEERSVKAKHRRSGGRTKGPAARTARDDQRFGATLRRLLQTMFRERSQDGDERKT